MARKKNRTAADIAMDITIAEMDGGSTDYIHFGFDASRNHVISGDHAPRAMGSHDGSPGVDWSITLYPDATHNVTGNVPGRILAML